jgi:energy-coupling factor transporter ATP-binding protein EcfA2
MRLRYVRIRNLPPLEDVEIRFGHEQALGRACAIHFVVGVNGSGKSRLLQALAEVFLHLEQQRVPSFSATVVYDREVIPESHTISFHRPEGAASKATFKVFKKSALPLNVDCATLHDRTDSVVDFTGDNLPGSGTIGIYLPSVLVGYTSGATGPWERIFAPPTPALDEVLADAPPEVELESERPAGWSIEREVELKTDDPTTGARLAEMVARRQSSESSQMATIGLFVSPEALRWALCTTSLAGFIEEHKKRMTDEADEKQFVAEITKSIETRQRMPGQRGILNEVDWLWPVTITLRIVWRPERLVRQRQTQIAQLARIATRVLREPGQQESLAGRTFHFDLRREVNDSEDLQMSTAEGLYKTLGGTAPTPLSFFRELMAWKKEGLLSDVEIVLRKRNVPDLLLYDWLSDGERMFLGRMALFHLLAGTSDALLILDEPETHFNDVWKREIVDIIDDSLGSDASDVLITTHSCIALTDAFDNEITLFHKELENGRVSAMVSPVRSFGAATSEIMREIFGASDNVGKRASEFLDLVLHAAAHADAVEKIWKLNGDETRIRQSDEFRTLLSRPDVTAPPREGFDGQLLTVIASLRNYATAAANEPELKLTDALGVLENRLGSGYYQFEFRRRLRALRRPQNAS